jgi:hypothetical protein
LAVSTVIVDHSSRTLQRIATKVVVRQRTIVNYGGCKLRQALELKLSREGHTRTALAAPLNPYQSGSLERAQCAALCVSLNAPFLQH